MKRFLFIALICLTPFAAQAHKAWLLPSATVLPLNQFITVDAAVSNDLFYFSHMPLRLDNLRIIAPDGSSVAAQSPHTGKYRSVFDLELKLAGTYKIAVVNQGLFASWEENGETKRWRGNAEGFATEVLSKVEKLQVGEINARIETFVSAGAPNDTALRASGSGLEMLPLTHPNDLYAGESASFQFLIDGKPASALQVTIVPGGTRYRDQQAEVVLSTDAEGRFNTTWAAPGMYWLEAALQDDKTSVTQAIQRRVSYVATLEVLAQ